MSGEVEPWRPDDVAELDRLLEAWAARHALKSPDTGKAYVTRLRQVFPDLVDRWQRRGRITRTDAMEMYQEWQRRPGQKPGTTWSDSTLDLTLIAVRVLWHDLAKDGILPADCPFDDIPLLRPDESRRAERVLTPDEAHAVIRACRPGMEQTFALFLYGSACRVSDAVGATWGQFTRDGIGEMYWTFRSKGKKVRTVWIQPGLWHALQTLPAPHGRSDRLFPFTRYKGYHIIRRAGNKAGLADRIVTPHVMRHTHATEAVEAGIPLIEISDQLGHARLATTLTYVHMRPGPRSGRAIHLPDLEDGEEAGREE